ncbi:MAG: NAD-dependent epimerase/dehydratase family protein [Armatimonadota bacterium]
MKVMLIGGTGLISTAITQRLLKEGADVVHVNRGLTPPRYKGKVTEIVCDRYTPEFTRTLREHGPYDVVIDMCCYHKDQLWSAIEGVQGITKQFIFCSTVDVYRKPAAVFPITEDEALLGHTNYAQNKIACEELVMTSARDGAFEATIIRPSCTYGEGGKVIHTFGWETWFLSRLEAGMPIVLCGDGTSMWSWCHVDDEAKAFAGACLNPAAYGQRYHAASDELLTWNTSVAIIADAMGAPPPMIVHIPVKLLHQLVPEHSQISFDNFAWPNFYDNARAKKDLGFATTVPFSEGAKRTIDWIKANGGFQPASADPVTDKVVAAWDKAKAAFLS